MRITHLNIAIAPGCPEEVRKLFQNLGRQYNLNFLKFNQEQNRWEGEIPTRSTLLLEKRDDISGAILMVNLRNNKYVLFSPKIDRDFFVRMLPYKLAHLQVSWYNPANN